MKASEAFEVGKNNIGWVDSDFTKEFGNDSITKGKVLTGQKLGRYMTDAEILQELGVQECTLGDILATLKEATPEMKDGWANLFYVKDHPSRVVRVFWGGDGWSVRVWQRGDYGWGAGCRVFSPATGRSETKTSESSDALTLRVEELEEFKRKVEAVLKL